jgi:hypothetical protein
LASAKILGVEYQIPESTPFYQKCRETVYLRVTISLTEKYGNDNATILLKNFIKPNWIYYSGKILLLPST